MPAQAFALSLAALCICSLNAFHVQPRLKKYGLILMADGSPEMSNFDKLKEEAENPFRTLRLFLYGAAGANAAIGGFTSLAQLAGTLGDAPSALPLDQVTQNLAVDFGVVAFAAALYRFDTAAAQVNRDAAAASAQGAKTRLSKDDMAAREAVLAGLPIEVVVGGAGETKRAAVAEVQAGAKQSVVVLAGDKAIIKESLLKAKLLGDRFAKQNVLVVPYQLGSKGGGGANNQANKGFGRATWEDRPYVAQAVREDASEEEKDQVGNAETGWRAYIDDELEAAAVQAGISVADLAAQGIVIVANKEGKIVRRGLGVPKWEIVISDLSMKKEAK